MKAVFGPVDSWQLGRVLCVDMAMSDRKYCTFDCIYCPQRRATRGMTRRRWFVPLSWVEAQISSFVPEEADWVTFTGRGEPTLASNLGQTIDYAKAHLGRPIAVLTNSSLLPRDDVKNDLAKADMVVAKLDAPNEDLFRAINRPFGSISLADIVGALREFRGGYGGRLALQLTLLEANRPAAKELAAIARSIAPDEVQLNTGASRRLVVEMPKELERICDLFAGLNLTGIAPGEPPEQRAAVVRDLPWIRRANTEVMLMGLPAA